MDNGAERKMLRDIQLKSSKHGGKGMVFFNYDMDWLKWLLPWLP